VPKSVIDNITDIWNSIMPHRIITFLDGKVMAQKVGQSKYHGKEMSDGERVMLYFIGQCLCLPRNSIIIIDEPEIHLHKSLVNKLWDKIETYVQDKLLIYITHDLEFASSRNDATKLWIKEYNGNNQWVWDEIPADEKLPEGLILEIIGNRKNVIFCEGERGKIDSTIYQLVYPDFHIIPRGGGFKVVEATKAFRANNTLHHISAFGIIDCDYKEDEEIKSLESNGVYTISVAEIENLFCIEPILRIVAEHMQLNADPKINEVIDFLIDALRDEFDVQVSSKAEKIIEYKLGAFSKEANTEQGLIKGLETTISRINIHKIYEEVSIQYHNAIENRNLDQLLLIYNRKSLPDRISPIFGLNKGEYSKLLVRLLKSSYKSEIIKALKDYLPDLHNEDIT
jgi:hypothetical protein